MKIRQKILLNILVSQGTVSINELAEDFAVSSRTVRNDYKLIREYLNSLMQKPCVELCNNNIRLLLDEGELETIHKSVKACDYYLYKLSAFEREMLILSELIYSNDYVTIEALAEKMYVSRGTINKDMVRVREWCGKNSVEILSRKARGFKINIDEKKRRSVIARLIRYSSDPGKQEGPGSEIDICKRFFKNVDLLKVKDLLVEAEDRYGLILPDAVFEALTIHIGLSVERSLEHKNMNIDNDISRIEKSSTEYRMAAYIVSKIEAVFAVEMPETEVYYIALHILGKAVLEKDEEAVDKWLNIQIITTKLIKNVGAYTGHRFENDIRLNEGLYHHLLTTLLRMKNNEEYENPFREQMIKDYPVIYEAVKANIAELQHYGKVELSRDEMAYIILHFAASIERNRQKPQNRPARVIILCSTGIGTSRMVQSRVLQCFRLDIVKVLALHQLKQQLAYENADFIISTVPVKAEIPVIQVSPLVTEKEIQKISDLLLDLGFGNYFSEPPNNLKSNAFAKQVRQLLETCISEKELKNSLEQLLKNKQENTELQQDISGWKGSMDLMLSDVLREAYISLEDDSGNWEEAVAHAGEKLLENGIITRDYIDETIRNVRETGPYIVITKGVAIPHANNKLGVTRTAISLVRLRKGINFGNEQNDPVRYVFMLATVDSSSHLQALSELVTLLSEGEFYRVIDSAASAREIIEYIKEFEENGKGEGV